MTKPNHLIVLGLLLAASGALAEDDPDVTHVWDESSDRRPLQTIVPVYPKRALRERIQGEVEVCFNVDRKGRTSKVAVRNSSNRMFEKPSILAVRASSYVPLAADRKMSGIKTCRTFRFLLDPVAITDPSEELAVEP
jgi:TonB family protein